MTGELFSQDAILEDAEASLEFAHVLFCVFEVTQHVLIALLVHNVILLSIKSCLPFLILSESFFLKFLCSHLEAFCDFIFVF